MSLEDEKAVAARGARAIIRRSNLKMYVSEIFYLCGPTSDMPLSSIRLTGLGAASLQIFFRPSFRGTSVRSLTLLLVEDDDYLDLATLQAIFDSCPCLVELELSAPNYSCEMVSTSLSATGQESTSNFTSAE